MVVDATVPSLVLLTVVLAAILVARLVTDALERRTRRTGRGRTAVVAPASRCPRVVLLDDDRWPLAA